MFEISEKAAAQVMAAAEQGGTEGMVLRLAAQMKQDGTIDYLMGFDQPKEGDVRIESRGVAVVMVKVARALVVLASVSQTW